VLYHLGPEGRNLLLPQKQHHLIDALECTHDVLELLVGEEVAYCEDVRDFGESFPQGRFREDAAHGVGLWEWLTCLRLGDELLRGLG
jgi:hypothetical protein